MSCLGDDLVDFESRKLSSLSGLGALSYFDLDFFGIDEVFGRYTETSRRNLLDFTVERNAVTHAFESIAVFSPFTRVAARAESVHCKGDSLMCFYAQGSEAHGRSDKSLHNVADGFYFVDGKGLFGTLEVHQVTDEDGFFLVVNQGRILFILRIVAGAGGQLQSRYHFGCPGMTYAVFPV